MQSAGFLSARQLRKCASVTEAAALHVLVGDFDHQFGPQRFPGQVFALAPAALAARHAMAGFAVCSSCSAQRLPRMTGKRIFAIRREKFDKLATLLLGEARADADVLKRARIVEEPEKQRTDSVRSPFLCQRKPATTQSQSRSCLTLSMTRLSGS